MTHTLESLLPPYRYTSHSQTSAQICMRQQTTVNQYLDKHQFKQMRTYPPDKVPLGSQPELTPVADALQFDSKFESGNLRKAIHVSSNEYNLFLEYDVETQGHTQWYYFAVKNFGKTGTVRFNILNLMKANSLYTAGLKPAVYSARQPERGWHRDCSGISYFKNSIIREGPGAPRNYFTLSFSYAFTLPEDTVYFAHCYPYTYSDLRQYLDARCSDPTLVSILRRNLLCLTLAKNECYVVTITQDVQTLSWEREQAKLQKSAAGRRMTRLKDIRLAEQLRKLEKVRKTKPVPGRNEEHKAKKVVVLTARVHPGESNSSFMMQGALDFLLGNSKEAAHLRKHYIFKVVPMLNPDGVVYGNYRCSLLGVDLNRRWKKPSIHLHPTIYSTKKLVQVLSEEHEVALVCDFHGHSAKTHAFVYGCTSDSYDSVRENCFIKLLPFSLAKRNAHFSFAKSHFRMDKSKETTARMVLFSEMGVLNSFTLEASFFGTDGNHFSTSDLGCLGKDLLLQLSMFTSPTRFNRRLQKMIQLLTPVPQDRDNPTEETEEQPEKVVEGESADALHISAAIQLIDEQMASKLEFEEEDTDFEGSDGCPSDNDDRKLQFIQTTIKPPQSKKRFRGSSKRQQMPAQSAPRFQSTPRITHVKVPDFKPEFKPGLKPDIVPRLRRHRYLDIKPIGRLAERILNMPNLEGETYSHELTAFHSTEPSNLKCEVQQGVAISSLTGIADSQSSQAIYRNYHERLKRSASKRTDRHLGNKHPRFFVTKPQS